MMVGFIPSILPLSLLYPIEPPFPISPRPKSLRKEADPKKVKFDEAGVLQDAPSSELCLWLYHCNIATSQDIGKMMKNGAMINFSILWGLIWRYLPHSLGPRRSPRIICPLTTGTLGTFGRGRGTSVCDSSRVRWQNSPQNQGRPCFVTCCKMAILHTMAIFPVLATKSWG